MSELTFDTFYKYTCTLKLCMLGDSIKLNSIFPNSDDFTMTSRKFDSLESAVNSCNAMNENMIKSLNVCSDGTQFSTLCEVNPTFDESSESVSEWDDSEIAKIWIVKKNQSGVSLNTAVSLTKIEQFTADESHLLN